MIFCLNNYHFMFSSILLPVLWPAVSSGSCCCSHINNVWYSGNFLVLTYDEEYDDLVRGPLV